MATIFVNKQSN